MGVHVLGSKMPFQGGAGSWAKQRPGHILYCINNPISKPNCPLLFSSVYDLEAFFSTPSYPRDQIRSQSLTLVAPFP